MAAVTVASASDDWRKDNGKYVPFPTTWLRGRRWEDEIAPQPPASVAGNGQAPRPNAEVQRLRQSEDEYARERTAKAAGGGAT